MKESLIWKETIEVSKENETEESKPKRTEVLLVLRIKISVFWM
jgi:hypothetical protein